jgi:hypothetical protein
LSEEAEFMAFLIKPIVISDGTILPSFITFCISSLKQHMHNLMLLHKKKIAAICKVHCHVIFIIPVPQNIPNLLIILQKKEPEKPCGTLLWFFHTFDQYEYNWQSSLIPTEGTAFKEDEFILCLK